MTDKEYQQKKRECWEEFLQKHEISTADGVTADAFITAFDRAFSLSKLEKKKPKRICLRDRSKVCNLCHECDIDISNPRY